MTSAPGPITIKLGELSDAVDAVPYLLGFIPTDSIVAVALCSPRERMGFTLRLDLLPVEYDREVAEMIAWRMKAAGAESVMLFVYPKRRPTVGRTLPRRPLINAIDRALDVPIREAVLVTADRTWSYICSDVDCCPPQGRLRPTGSPSQLALEAAHTLNGRAMFASRDDAVASVQPVAGAAAARMESAIESAAAKFFTMSPRAYLRNSRRVAIKLRDSYVDRPGHIEDDEAALVIVGMQDWQLRDEMLGWAGTHEDVMRSLFDDLARLAIPPWDAPACTALAFVAYVQGEGLIAATALDRALSSDPSYSLANTLSEALEGQVDPAQVRRGLMCFATET